jgi:hypothetical protein
MTGVYPMKLQRALALRLAVMIFEPTPIIEVTLGFEMAEVEDVGEGIGRGRSLETE